MLEQSRWEVFITQNGHPVSIQYHISLFSGESNLFSVTPATCDLFGILPDNYCTAYSSAESYTWRASVVGEEDNPLLLGGRACLSLKVRSGETISCQI